MKPKLIITDVALNDDNIVLPIKRGHLNLVFGLEIKVVGYGRFVDYFKEGKFDDGKLLTEILDGTIEIISADKT